MEKQALKGLETYPWVTQLVRTEPRINTRMYSLKSKL